MEDRPFKTLLICTVGGTAAPIVAAIKGAHPERVLFIPSSQTRHEIREQILPLLDREGISLSPGQYEVIPVPDAQDFTGCVEKIRAVEPDVRQWLQRGGDFRVIIDLTGGTKCMSAAMAIVAQRWPCLYSYVGGTERNKGGVGVVVDGKESVYHTQNPWDALGYQTAEEAVMLFNRGDYQAAVNVLDSDLPRMENPAIKAELGSLKIMSEAYLAWDLFDHKNARSQLEKVSKNLNHLCHLLQDRYQETKLIIQRHLDFLAAFESEWGQHTIVDLCANAQRCAARGRYDDAVARLYRTIEAIAQLRLKEGYGIADTGKVPLEKIPKSLCNKWAQRAKNGTLLLGLQDDYQLLETLNDPLAQRFSHLGLAGEKSPLSTRNQSILAHGFAPVSKTVFNGLFRKTLDLAEIKESELPQFPVLSDPTDWEGT